ncbi:MAG: hypothetical protein Q8N35_08275 [Methylococcaceae bacterium]|nr:hypothetical protein [Methylococcaceae bacterium]MDZ4154910.1 hypothetical protein [Methylococcales bacterium]MDP2392463.1 hypothetical protein [Methylococcaceae bacterium]MDP3019569.1 hypothetical protein [Methylococcaceae bacterium]MDP3388347.1 hypothetical protein [Methylococcaceae bacterium]
MLYYNIRDIVHVKDDVKKVSKVFFQLWSNKMAIRWLKPMLALALSVSFSAAMAEEHLHATDIQPWKADGQVFINSNLFETDFGDLTGGDYLTDEPGFVVDISQGAFTPGNWLQFQGLGTLKFWDGLTWNNNVPNGEYVDIESLDGSVTSFSVSGVSNPIGLVGQFDSDGFLHSHLDMSIRTASNVLGGSVGAYWIELQLFETLANSNLPVSIASAPFSLIFNRGLDSVAYETAVSAVPVPAAFWLFGSVLVGLIPATLRRVNSAN